MSNLTNQDCAQILKSVNHLSHDVSVILSQYFFFVVDYQTLAQCWASHIKRCNRNRAFRMNSYYVMLVLVGPAVDGINNLDHVCSCVCIQWDTPTGRVDIHYHINTWILTQPHEWTISYDEKEQSNRGFKPII